MTDAQPNAHQHSTPDAAIENAIAADTAASRSGKLGWLSIIVVAAFALFFAYDLFAAISNVIGRTAEINDENAIRGLVGRAAVSPPWLVFALDLIAPPLVFALCLLLGRKHTVFVKTIVFVVGLTVVSAVSLTLIALA